jgi:hypothetical protein
MGARTSAMMEKSLLVRPYFDTCDLVHIFVPDTKADMTLIGLKANSLYDKDKVDLETVVLDDVFTLLQCNEEGLTEAEAKRRLELVGLNKLESMDQNSFLQVCLFIRPINSH